MATIALIQDLFRVLTHTSDDRLHGLEQQIWGNFYEALEDEYNHDVQVAPTLEAYRAAGHTALPDVIICTPFPEEGNPAPGIAQINALKEALPGVPIIVWSTRSESSLRMTCLVDLGCAAYYTGTLLDAPADLPEIITEALA